METKNLLRIEELKLYFRTRVGEVQAVDGVNFDLNYNRAVVVLGESGCGKTSLAKAILRLLPRNISVQVFSALLENAASEQGARMSAMDNATRNAGELIKKLTIQYNRSRQAAITTELVEIIAGAEAL